MIISNLKTSVEHLMNDGRKGQILFNDGLNYEIVKRKDGILEVVKFFYNSINDYVNF